MIPQVDLWVKAVKAELLEELEPQLKFWSDGKHRGYIIPEEVWNQLKEKYSVRS